MWNFTRWYLKKTIRRKRCSDFCQVIKQIKSLLLQLYLMLFVTSWRVDLLSLVGTEI